MCGIVGGVGGCEFGVGGFVEVVNVVEEIEFLCEIEWEVVGCCVLDGESVVDCVCVVFVSGGWIDGE